MVLVSQLLISKSYLFRYFKINVNTENQIEFTKAVREVLNKDQEVYDPRKFIGPGRDAIKATVIGKIREFGSNGKA